MLTVYRTTNAEYSPEYGRIKIKTGWKVWILLAVLAIIQRKTIKNRVVSIRATAPVCDITPIKILVYCIYANSRCSSERRHDFECM